MPSRVRRELECWIATLEVMANQELMRQIRAAQKEKEETGELRTVPWEEAIERRGWNDD